MYNDLLTEELLPIDKLHLDPNNPRFWSEQTKDLPLVPDTKVADEVHQTRSLESISRHGIDELKKSILRNGFLPLDRIVVRELDGCPGEYVVIEGNRRLAALKTLRKEIDEGLVSEEGIEPESDYLKDLFARTNKIAVLVYLGDEKRDIAWILQGIRHIGGIKEWEPAQQGKLVADQIDQDGLSLTQAGQMFGLSAQAVGRRYRTYKALEQMRNDPEYSSKAANKYYSLFEEAIRQKTVKTWLGWNNSSNRFENEDNLHQFYDWIIPDEENDERRRRIHDPRHIKYLGAIIDSEKTSLLTDIDNHEIEIETAHQRVRDAGKKFDWKSALETAESLVDEIPASALADNPQAILKLLERLKNRVESLISMAESEKSEADQI